MTFCPKCNLIPTIFLLFLWLLNEATFINLDHRSIGVAAFWFYCYFWSNSNILLLSILPVATLKAVLIHNSLILFYAAPSMTVLHFIKIPISLTRLWTNSLLIHATFIIFLLNKGWQFSRYFHRHIFPCVVLRGARTVIYDRKALYFLYNGEFFRFCHQEHSIFIL